MNFGTPDNRTTKSLNKIDRVTNSAGPLRILSANRSSVVISRNATNSERGYTTLRNFFKESGNKSERNPVVLNKSISVENLNLETLPSQDPIVRPKTEGKSIHSPKKSSFTIQRISNLKFGETPVKKSTEIMSATTRIMAGPYNATKAPFSRGWSQEPSEIVVKKEGDTKKINEKISFLKDQLNSFSKLRLGNDETTNSLKNTIVHHVMVLDKVNTRYISADTAENYFLDSVLEAELQITKLFKNLKKFMHSLAEENENLHKTVKNIQNEIVQSKQKSDENTQKLITSITTFEPKDSEIKIQHELLKKDIERKEMIWSVEKQKLLAEIEFLSKQIYDYENENNVTRVKAEMGKMVEKFTNKMHDYDAVIEKRSAKLYRLELDLANERYAKDYAIKQFGEIEKQYKEKVAENAVLEEFKSSALEKIRTYRETFNMLKEDYLGKEERGATAFQTIKQQKKEINRLVARIDGLIMQFNSRKHANETDHKKDVNLIESYKQAYTDRKGPGLCIEVGKFDRVAADAFAVEKIKIEKYCLSRPNFYTFIREDYEKCDTSDAASMEIPDLDVIQMIRGIFDSKYNEYLFYQDIKAVSHFTDFVFSWLGSFHIDPVTLKVRNIGPDDGLNVNMRRIRLFAALVQNHLSQVWDVTIFKEFLEENYTNDEIFFFLHCRYLLFQGAQLDFLEGGVNLVHYIRTDRSLRLLDIVLSKVEPDQMKTFKNLMKQRSKYKFGSLIIDAGLVLKTLLDFYRIEKKWKFQAIQDDFMKISDRITISGINMNFSMFKSFMEMQYPSATDLDKARLFRESWCYGNGKVDNESFFIAATESGFFIDCIIKQEFKNLSPVTLKETPKEELSIFIDHITNKYDSFLDLIIHCKKIVGSFGLETLYNKTEQLEIYLNKKNLIDESKINLFYNCFIELLATFVKVRNQRLTMYSDSMTGKGRIYEQDLKALEKIIRSSIIYSNDNRALMNEKIEKLRKFQLYVRLKKYKFLDILKALKEKVAEERRSVEDKRMGEKITTEDIDPLGNNNSPRKKSASRNTKSRNVSASSVKKSPKKKPGL